MTRATDIIQASLSSWINVLAYVLNLGEKYQIDIETTDIRQYITQDEEDRLNQLIGEQIK